MEVINKLYSTVSQTVSQLSSVLPGNPVTREYEVTKQVASAGKECIWRIYHGVKRTTKQEASIFVLEKRHFERLSKEERDEIFEVIKHGVTQLTKIRHPQVLTVQHPLEESRESFAFATEPVYASMANILGDTSNVPQPNTTDYANYNLNEVEIKYGILQLIEGLKFIHNEAKLVHRNICPHNIILDSNGIWKVFGFDYSVKTNDVSKCFVGSSSKHELFYPCLQYVAPESILDGVVTENSDKFSLGMLICSIYGKNGESTSTLDYNFNTARKTAMKLKSSNHPCVSSVPFAIRDFVTSLLAFDAERRPNLQQLTQHAIFDDIGVRSLSYLGTLFQRDNQEKAKFYKELPQIINRLPNRVNIHRVLSFLVKEFVHPTMIPFVLPNVFLIAKLCSKDEFQKHIFVHLKSITNLHEPVQISLIFMQNMGLLLKLTSPEDIKLYILPMLYKALESSHAQIQQICLEVIPSLGPLIDHQAMRTSLLPRIKHLCNSNCSAPVRVNCLLCIGQLLPHLDKWLVLDDVLLFLPTIASREPAVIMAIIGIIKVMSTHESLGIPKDLCANKVLPFLWPLSIENGLALHQYNAVMALIKELSQKVEQEHKKKLEQLGLGNESDALHQHGILVADKGVKDLTLELKGNGLELRSARESSSDAKPLATMNHTNKPSGFQTASVANNMPISNATPSVPMLYPMSPRPPSQPVPNYQPQTNFTGFNPPMVNGPMINQFQRPPFQQISGPMISPMSISNVKTSPPGAGSSTNILSKEDIMEFLK